MQVTLGSFYIHVPGPADPIPLPNPPSSNPSSKGNQSFAPLATAIGHLALCATILAQTSSHWEKESLTALNRKVAEKQSQAKPLLCEELEL